MFFVLFIMEEIKIHKHKQREKTFKKRRTEIPEVKVGSFQPQLSTDGIIPDPIENNID